MSRCLFVLPHAPGKAAAPRRCCQSPGGRRGDKREAGLMRSDAGKQARAACPTLRPETFNLFGYLPSAFIASCPVKLDNGRPGALMFFDGALMFLIIPNSV